MSYEEMMYDRQLEPRESEPEAYRCPCCGAVLDSIDDKVLVDRDNDVIGCSKCCRVLWVNDWEDENA
jgi:uncharacterized protein with PIN domain